MKLVYRWWKAHIPVEDIKTTAARDEGDASILLGYLPKMRPLDEFIVTDRGIVIYGHLRGTLPKNQEFTVYLTVEEGEDEDE